MIVSFTKKFIFFKPIKTAGSSVEEALSRVCDPKVDIVTPDSHRSGMNHVIGEVKLFNHIRLPEFLDTGVVSLHQFENDFHKITVCRNPWDKQVSSFWHVMRIRKTYEGLTRSQIENRYLTDFREYIVSVCRDDREGQQRVSREFFFYEDGKPFFDSLIRFEYLQRDFDILCTQLSFPKMQLPRLKTDTRLLKGDYMGYYTKETEILVKECYSEAISFFGYRFGER